MSAQSNQNEFKVETNMSFNTSQAHSQEIQKSNRYENIQKTQSSYNAKASQESKAENVSYSQSMPYNVQGAQSAVPKKEEISFEISGENVANAIKDNYFGAVSAS